MQAVRSWETQRHPRNSNGSLAQRRPVSPSCPILGSADQPPLALPAPPQGWVGHSASKQALAQGKTSAPRPGRRDSTSATKPRVSLAESETFSEPQRQEEAKPEIGGGLEALESGFLNPNHLAAWPRAGCLTCLRRVPHLLNGESDRIEFTGLSGGLTEVKSPGTMQVTPGSPGGWGHHHCRHGHRGSCLAPAA